MHELFSYSADKLERLNKRLTHHALCKMRRLAWRGAYINKGGSVPAAYEPQDFALDAIRKMLDGTRPWNRDQYMTVEAALRASIDSDISHLVESVDNIKGKRLAPQTSKDETAKAYEIAGADDNPATIVIDRDWRDRFHHAAVKELSGEPLLEKLLDCIESGFIEPTEIAELLEISPDDVTNLKKRLRRKLEKLDPQFKPLRKKVVS